MVLSSIRLTNTYVHKIDKMLQLKRVHHSRRLETTLFLTWTIGAAPVGIYSVFIFSLFALHLFEWSKTVDLNFHYHYGTRMVARRRRQKLKFILTEFGHGKLVVVICNFEFTFVAVSWTGNAWSSSPISRIPWLRDRKLTIWS